MRPMTVREAVEIVEELARASEHEDFDCGQATMDRWGHARAIVDALVEADEAWCDACDNGGFDRWDKYADANDKLRALTRGEQQQPKETNQ